MKKLLLSTIVTFGFALSTIVFQVSCQKEANADVQSKTSVEQQSKILLIKYENLKGSVYTSNIDGTNLKEVILPDSYGDIHARITSDGKNIVLSFSVDKTYTNRKIYICSIDGSNLKELSGLSGYELADVY